MERLSVPRESMNVFTHCTNSRRQRSVFNSRLNHTNTSKSCRIFPEGKSLTV